MKKNFGPARGFNFSNHPREIIGRDEIVKETMEKIEVLGRAKISSMENNGFGAGVGFSLGS